MNPRDPSMLKCNECQQHYFAGETICPHCGAAQPSATGFFASNEGEDLHDLMSIRVMYGPAPHLAMLSHSISRVLAGSRFIVARSLMKSTRAGQLLDDDEEPLAQIRVSPRIVWGCLTVIVSVVLFFGTPVLMGWLVNQILILCGTSLQTIVDQNLMLGIPLIIVIVCTGILSAMSASWSLYRQKWRLLDEHETPFLSLTETAKYGAASLSVIVKDAGGNKLGKIHRDVWGTFTLFNSSGEPSLCLRREGSTLQKAGQDGLMAAATGAIAFAVAMLFGGIVLITFPQRREPYRIVRRHQDAVQPEELLGNVLPMEPRAHRVNFSKPLDHSEKVMVVSAVIIKTMYDF